MLRIDIAFELTCPWCFIGQRQLADAQHEFSLRHPNIPVELDWHPVQLLPQLPDGGVPYAAFYRQRLGGDAAVAARQAQVQAAAAAVGQEIEFSRIRVMPNTSRAHALLALAAQRQGPSGHAVLLERLFAAYFVHGEDIGDQTTLAALAYGCNLADRASATAQAAPAASPEALRRQGVPHFVFNRRHARSGALGAPALLVQMEAALAAAIDPLQEPAWHSNAVSLSEQRP